MPSRLAAPAPVTVRQVAVFGDRMLPFLVAVVGVDAASAAQWATSRRLRQLPDTAAALEAALLAQFAAAMPHGAAPEYWCPRALLVHVVADGSGDANGGDAGAGLAAESVLPTLRRMCEWRAGGPYRTHLGKLRRGVLAAELRDALAGAFVLAAERPLSFSCR